MGVVLCVNSATTKGKQIASSLEDHIRVLLTAHNSSGLLDSRQSLRGLLLCGLVEICHQMSYPIKQFKSLN